MAQMAITDTSDASTLARSSIVLDIYVRETNSTGREVPQPFKSKYAQNTPSASFFKRRRTAA